MPLWQICLIKDKNQTQTLYEAEIKMIGNLWPGDFLYHCGKLKQSLGVPGDGLFLSSVFPVALVLLWDQLYFLRHFGSVSGTTLLLSSIVWVTVGFLPFHLSRISNQKKKKSRNSLLGILIK